MTVPVILLHRGPQEYVKYVAEQARRFDNEVFVLGDASVSCRTHDINDYDMDMSFRSVYEHLSTNSFEIELLCFTRWFALYEFMRSHGIETCLHIDSDVLLFCDVTDEYKKNFSLYDLTLTHRCSGHSSYFTTMGLAKFCSFLLKTYSEKQSYDYEKIASHYHIRRKHNLPGGVCDMTLLEYYSYKICGSVGEMMHIVNESTWDHNINDTDQGYKMRDNVKDVEFHFEHMPFVQHPSGLIRFNSLHCQGPAKSLILRLCDARK